MALTLDQAALLQAVEQIKVAESLVHRHAVLNRLSQTSIKVKPHSRHIEAKLIDGIGVRLLVPPHIKLSFVMNCQMKFTINGRPFESFTERR